MKTDYEKQMGCSTPLFIIMAITVIMVMFLCSCQKEPDHYTVASKGDSIEWHFQMDAYTQVVIHGWGSAQCNGNRDQSPPFPDTVYKMSAWNGNRNIIGLPYDVWIFTDETWGFVGYGIVKNHNDIKLER